MPKYCSSVSRLLCYCRPVSNKKKQARLPPKFEKYNRFLFKMNKNHLQKKMKPFFFFFKLNNKTIIKRQHKNYTQIFTKTNQFIFGINTSQGISLPTRSVCVLDIFAFL